MVFKVGYVPEHFSTPIAFAESLGFFKQFGLEIELIPYPSGSGHLIQSLEDNSLDIAIGLTEAFVRGLAQGKENYKLIGTYVKSPLRWSISTGYNRDELTSQDQLQSKRISISRIGSGSHVMSFVLALQQGFQKPFYSEFPIVSTFKNLRDSVNLKEGVEPSDAFMWEHFTTKRYYDNKEVKKIGEIYTPWPSWVINARTELVNEKKEELKKFIQAIELGINHFEQNQEDAIKYIYTNLDYSEEDAREWIKTVHFNSRKVATIDWETVVNKTSDVLIEAGVLEDDKSVIDTRLEAGVLSIV